MGVAKDALQVIVATDGELVGIGSAFENILREHSFLDVIEDYELAAPISARQPVRSARQVDAAAFVLKASDVQALRRADFDVATLGPLLTAATVFMAAVGPALVLLLGPAARLPGRC